MVATRNRYVMSAECWEAKRNSGIEGPSPKPEGWDELDLIRQCLWQYANMDGLWGEYGRRGSGMALHPTAVARIGLVMGWLGTMRDRDMAMRLAKDFIWHLDRLATYAGNVHLTPPPMCLEHKRDMVPAFGEDLTWKCPDCGARAAYAEGPEVNIPRYIVDIRDDGTFGGFSLCWYAAIPEKEKDQHPNAQWLKDERGYNVVRRTHDYAHSYQYAYSFNGGLLLHGLGEVFAVELNPQDGPHWSIHT